MAVCTFPLRMALAEVLEDPAADGHTLPVSPGETLGQKASEAIMLSGGINLGPYTCTACGYDRFRDRGARNESLESCIDDAKNALMSAQVWLDVALQWLPKKRRALGRPSAMKRRRLLALKRALGRVQEKLDAQ